MRSFPFFGIQLYEFGCSAREVSAKQFFVGFLVEADDERFAFSQSRRSQIAGRAEEQLGERCVVGLVFFHVDVNDVFAFRGVDVARLLG